MADNENRFRVISNNALLLKSLAILCVAFGHFYTMGPVKIHVLDYWWNISSLALLFFSMTSAYFTNIKYSKNIVLTEYWKKKLYRIWLKLFVTQTFLLIIFLVEGRDNIFTIHSLINIFGFNGFLNWLRIPGNSPFGAGMWFLTLLILFYIVYPALKILYSNKICSIFTTIFSIIVLLILDRNIHYGHTLWLTAAGFFIGMFFSTVDLTFDVKKSVFSFFIVFFIFLAMNFFQVKWLNSTFHLILTALIFIVFANFQINPWLVNKFRLVNNSIFEIFIIHSYLFIYPSSSFIFNGLLSFALIIIVAVMLSKLTQMLEQSIARMVGNQRA